MTENRLWAPWRLEYIRGPKPGECIFCKAAAAEDGEGHVVYRAKHSFVMLNAFPYNNGHVMVSPYEHVPSIEDLDGSVLLDLMQSLKRSLEALRSVYGPEGFNIGINQGRIAGAGVEDHVHMHVVPRWSADTNFMPVVGSTRVLPQSLSDSYAELKEAFSA